MILASVLLTKLVILFVYSNLLEYAIHRWLLHGWLWNSHAHHHADDSKNVLFVRNAPAMLGALALIGGSSALFSSWGWLPLTFFLFYYFVLIEAAHWIIHDRQHHLHSRRVPFFSIHHLEHHAELVDGNYNVWLPFGDWLFGTWIKS